MLKQWLVVLIIGGVTLGATAAAHGMQNMPPGMARGGGHMQGMGMRGTRMGMHRMMMRGRMQGRGMMRGHGMMGRHGMHGGSGAAAAGPVDREASDKLLGFITDEGLPCLSCHSVTNAGFGPAFGAVAARYDSSDGARSLLKSHISHGFGRMPGGLADSRQAETLARLILELSSEAP